MSADSLKLNTSTAFRKKIKEAQMCRNWLSWFSFSKRWKFLSFKDCSNNNPFINFLICPCSFFLENKSSGSELQCSIIVIVSHSIIQPENSAKGSRFSTNSRARDKLRAPGLAALQGAFVCSGSRSKNG